MSTFSIALVLSAAFIASFAIVFLLIFKFGDQRTVARLRNINPNRVNERSISVDYLNGFYDRFIIPLVKHSMPKKESDLEKVKKKFVNAGYRNKSVLERFFGFKTFIAIAIPFVFLIFLFLSSIGSSKNTISSFEVLMITIVLCAIGYYLPDGLISIRLKSRKQELMDSFPTAVDLIRVCIAAGMGLDAAISRVGAEIGVSSKAMAHEFSLLSAELRAGSTRSAALKNLAIRADLDEVKALVTMILQAERFGTSVNDALRIFSEDLRLKRKMAAQTQASKIPVKMSLPLILCIFPALFVVLIAPIAISIMDMMK